jgi:hypothetical protein
MQSFIQYRRIGLGVRKQLERDSEKSGFYFTQSRLPHNLQNGTHHSTPSSSSTSNSANNNTPDSQRNSITTNGDDEIIEESHFGHTLTGIHVRDRATHEGKGDKVFIVDWEGQNDPHNPRNWSVAYRVWIILNVALIAFVVGAASSTDTAILPQAAADFGVSDVVESMTIGMYNSILLYIQNCLTDSQVFT